jgi:hypothetical protein
MKTFSTQDKLLELNQDYLKVKEILYVLFDSGFATKYIGHCIDASRMVMAILAQNDIKSHMQECCALFTQGDKIKQLYAIGFYEDHKPGRIDTHFVTITETDTPLLIDMSIGQLLLNEEKIILERAENEMVLGNYTNENYKLTYIRK